MCCPKHNRRCFVLPSAQIEPRCAQLTRKSSCLKPHWCPHSFEPGMFWKTQQEKQMFSKSENTSLHSSPDKQQYQAEVFQQFHSRFTNLCETLLTAASGSLLVSSEPAQCCCAVMPDVFSAQVRANGQYWWREAPDGRAAEGPGGC